MRATGRKVSVALIRRCYLPTACSGRMRLEKVPSRSGSLNTFLRQGERKPGEDVPCSDHPAEMRSVASTPAIGLGRPGINRSVSEWLCVWRLKEAEASASGFHGYPWLHLDYGGNPGPSPIGLDPVGMLIGVSDDDHFISRRITHQLLQSRLHHRIRSYNRCSESVLHGCPLRVPPERLYGIDWWPQFDWLVSNESQKALLGCGEQSPGCRIRLSCNHLHRYHEVRLPKYFAWPELVAGQVSL